MPSDPLVLHAYICMYTYTVCRHPCNPPPKNPVAMGQLYVFSAGTFPFRIDVSQFRGGQPQHQVRVMMQIPGDLQPQVLGGTQFILPG